MAKLGVLFFITASLALCADSVDSFPEDCEERLKAMDDAMKIGLVITNPKPVTFKTPRDLVRNYCVPMKTHLKTIEEYKPCLRPFPRRLFMNVLSNAKKNARAICSSPKTRREFVSNLACFTPETYPKILQIGNDVTSLILHLANHSDVDAIVPHMCCGFHLVLGRAKDTAEKLCNESGVTTGSEYFAQLVKSAVSEAFDMMCPGLIDANHCREKLPDVVDNVRKIWRRNRNKKWDVSPAVAFLRIIDRMIVDGEGGER